MDGCNAAPPGDGSEATLSPTPAPVVEDAGSDADFDALLKAGTAAHKGSRFDEAIDAYRRALALRSSGQVSILLAHLLLTSPAPTPFQTASRRMEATALATAAAKEAASLPPGRERALMFARHGYFMFTASELLGGATVGGEEDAEVEASGAGGTTKSTPTPANTALTMAIASLEEAVAADAGLVLAWRNLSLAYRSARRLHDSATAMGRAVDADGAKSVDLLYRHANALKRAEQWWQALARFCDVLDVGGRHDRAVFWIRTTLAMVEGLRKTAGAALPPPPTDLMARVEATLARYAPAGGSGSSGDGGQELVPHDYIRQLFDGYATRFDHHLTVCLGYQTPRVMLEAVLTAVGGREAVSSRAWRRCADLGCGTGLAGVEFRPFVRLLAGVDLSGGMVAEARRRKDVYDQLDVGDVAGWLCSQAAGGCGGEGHDSAGGYDLVLAADVFVYIGDLTGTFRAAAAAMAVGGGASGPAPPLPPLFAFSTEAMMEETPVLADVPPSTPGGRPGVASLSEAEVAEALKDGFRLTANGRCTHTRRYLRALLQSCGFVLRSQTRTVIRRNAGADVMGDLTIAEHVGITAL